MVQESWFQTAMRRDVVQRAVRVALLVGTILALINHGNKLLAGVVDGTTMIQIVLTYLVPFSVSTWSSVQMARSQM